MESKLPNLSESARPESMRFQEIDFKISQMRQTISRVLGQDSSIRHSKQEQLDEQIRFLESASGGEESWIHIDMDMFYAAIEIRDTPSLESLPVAVINDSVVATANYVAREFGVRSGTPRFKALQQCPDLVIVPANMDKYKEESRVISEILRSYDSNCMAIGLDEAYIKVRQGNPNELASEIRQKILDTTKLTASAGIGANRLLAKMASCINKPNGQYEVTQKPREFMKNKKVRKIPGVGFVLEKILNGLGVYVCADIIRKKLELSVVLNQSQYNFLIKSALGLGKNDANDKKGQKSMSCSKTFDPTQDLDVIEEIVCEITRNLCNDMRRERIAAKVFVISVKEKDFTSRWAEEKCKEFVNEFEEVLLIAMSLVKQIKFTNELRYIRIKAYNLNKKQEFFIRQPKKKPPVSKGNFEFMNTFASFSYTGGAKECPQCGGLFSLSQEEFSQHIKSCENTARSAKTPISNYGSTLFSFFKKK